MRELYVDGTDVFASQVDVRDKDGSTPLSCAAVAGCSSVAQLRESSVVGL